MTPTAASSEAKRDSALVAAVDVAREAVETEVGASMVGDHLAVVMEDERLATHTFACLNPGYRGWTWAVTVARAPRAKLVTVNEVVLLPGPDAIVAPEWLPWSERVRAGDLGPGDVLPADADDQRLVPGFTASPTPSRSTIPARCAPTRGAGPRARARPVADRARRCGRPLGLGRLRPDDAHGTTGPDGMPTCGFMLPMVGRSASCSPCAPTAEPCRRPRRRADVRLRSALGGRGRGEVVRSLTSDEEGWDPLELGHS